jgi:subfamily B ATP-binding cassette protein MsbA
LGEVAQAPAAKAKQKVRWDGHARGLLRRLVQDWIWPRRAQIAVALLCTAGLAAATAGYPALIRLAFDALSNPGSVPLAWIPAGIVGITAARALFIFLHQVTATRVVTRMVTDMQKAAFAHLMNADFAQIKRETTGQLVSRLTNDLAAVQHAAQTALIAFIRDALIVAAVVAYMLYLDWTMTLALIVVGPAAIVPLRYLAIRLRSVAKRTQTELGGMTSLLTEKFAGARLIKALRLEAYAVERLNANFDRVFGLRMKAVHARARTLSLIEGLAGLVIAGAIVLAYWRVGADLSLVGTFVAYVGCLVIAGQGLRSFGNIANATSEGLAAAERLYEVLDEKPRIVDRPGARPLAVESGSIAFDNVSFAYAAGADKAAVRDFSLIVPGGATVALVGRSGAGKSTVINLAARLFDVDAGRILIDGQDLRDVTLASLRDAIAMVSQEITLFDDTIRANIALGRLGAGEEEMIAAAKAAAAHEFIVAQPDGYATMIGEGGLKLSGGQRQRLALARAVLKDAPILLLDEATSALDTESERLVQEALARFTRNRTTLVIAHRLSTVQRADLICLMEDGRLAESGTHAELLARNGGYARLCRSQTLLDLEPGVGCQVSGVRREGETTA